MKTLIYFPVVLLFLVMSFACNVKAQSKTNNSLTVLNIDCQGIDLTPVQMGNLVRIEVEKLGIFAVMDRYDNAYLIKKHELDIKDCYGKICLIEIGNVIGTDKILTGSVEAFGDIIIYTLRLIDVKANNIEKTKVIEFLYLPKEIQSMTRIIVQDLFGIPYDETQFTQLTKKYHYESMELNPDEYKVNLSGPRTGFTLYTGQTATVLKRDPKEGGYDAYPVMFQFGYQFEIQYLNAGHMQALFEIIPNITGLDQAMFLPSLTLMNGLRNNKNGFEFAFGPTFYVYKRAEGYFTSSGNWILKKDDLREIPDDERGYTYMMDSRGDATVGTAFIFAFGRTFKSGRLNIPINAYAIPHKSGWRFGLSFGYNAKARKNPNL